MDAERFDSLARVLARRTPRRAALRSGAGFAATLLGVAGLRAADAVDASRGRYTAVRTYAISGQSGDAQKALKGLLPSIEKTPGFVAYSVVDAGHGELITISTFSDEKASAAAAKLESDWIAKHASKMLPKKPAVAKGEAVVFSDLVVGCSCNTGVNDACGSNELICCAPAGSPPGAKGICITSASTCGDASSSTPPPTVAPAKAAAAACTANPGDACASNADCCVGQCGQGVCYCTDPSRPEVGCPCTTGDANACGGRGDLCCPGELGAHAVGTCSSPMATCDAQTGCRADGYACPASCTPGDACAKSEGGCCSGVCLEDGTCGAGGGGNGGNGGNGDGSCAASSASCTTGEECCSGNCNSSGQCYCTDPDRPDVGCPCTVGDASACGGRSELCCNGTCLSPMASCS